MALFKIEKGLAASLATARPTTNEGWCYFTKDDGKFYIDIETGNDLTKRVCLNANTADKLTCGNIGNSNTPVYFENGIPVACTDLDVDMDEYLPLTAGEENKLTGPLGLTQDIMYGTILPENGFEGQLFFLEDESSGEYLPSGGVAGQALVKNSDAEGDASWQDIVALPDGGIAGQALIKNSTSDGDASWQDIVALPKGGDIGQALIKVSAEDGDAEWKEIVALPKGGAQGQVLTKNSSTDGDADWITQTIALTGDVTGSGSFDGSGNLSITATIADDSHNHTKMIQHYTRSEIGTAPDFDNITQNGIFEMRDTLETTGETGNKPFNGYAPFVNLRAEHVVLQLTGTNNSGYFIRGKQGADTNLNDTTWKRLWVQGDSVTGAVWNDYAECRESDCDEPGYVLSENGDDTLSKSTERLAPFAGVSSDTWGFSQGETEKAKTHIAVAGRVLVYPYQDRNNYKPGDCVCAAPNGTVDIMTREEVINWPDRIVGTVSCVPDYEEWGGGESADRLPVKVNGRIWIKVK